jgi:hypothetical protein
MMKAFPNCLEEHNKYDHPNDVELGMDLRDYFAARAMQAFLSNELIYKAYAKKKNGSTELEENLSVGSYQIADTMLKAREQ